MRTAGRSFSQPQPSRLLPSEENHLSVPPEDVGKAWEGVPLSGGCKAVSAAATDPEDATGPDTERHTCCSESLKRSASTSVERQTDAALTLMNLSAQLLSFECFFCFFFE